MNQEIRNKLRNVVTQCRKLLEDSISQELEGKYAIFAKKDQVTADPSAKMSHLSEEEQAARKDILDHFDHIKARGFKPKDALDQLIREIAFTHLNRLCAYKMMEAREVYVGGQKFREAVSRGVNSNGVKFYLAEHPEDERLFNTGHQDVAYRHFLDWLGGALSAEIGVLFNPNDPANRLYPRQKTFDEVLDLLNGGGIKAEETELREQWPKIWSQDETIGWVYQYFTPKELRDQARKESQAPRNSYELAFRNQFFTPRYVVEFLTDNTLGRIWYEMRKGDTKIKDQCRYMVRRPTEVFLKDGEQPAKGAAETQDDLSQEELLKLPVHIPHRPKKDPRELKILDPACGSGHFLLYCFDLLLTIYKEAHADPELCPALKKDYPTLDALNRDAPRLILAHNLHGIDIDLRASQIAALALWLRCQRAYQEMGLKKDRPMITRSNFVCAEPMPGEEQMLKEFVGQLEPKVLGQVVEVVFDKMKLAGEAGSLLKIEEEIRDAVAAAKKQYIRETTQATDREGQPLLFTQAAMDRLAGKPEQPSHFDLSDITDHQFFEEAESRVVETLRSYAEKAHNGKRLQRRLFTEDAVRGFAFVDVCQKRYDVILMNPPFGEVSVPSRSYLYRAYDNASQDVFSAFVDRGVILLEQDGLLGALTSRLGFFLELLEGWREKLLGVSASLNVMADLGYGVLDDALVEAAAYTAQKRATSRGSSLFISLLAREDKGSSLAEVCHLLHSQGTSQVAFVAELASFLDIPANRTAYWVSPRWRKLFRMPTNVRTVYGFPFVGLQTGDDDFFLRLQWEIPESELSGDSPRWVSFAKGGEYSPFYGDYHLVVDWSMKDRARRQSNSAAYFQWGVTYTERTTSNLSARVLPPGCVFSPNGVTITPPKHRLLECAFILNTRLAQFFIEMCVGSGDAVHSGSAARHYGPRIVAGIPTVEASDDDRELVSKATELIWDRIRGFCATQEPDRYFISPFACTGVLPSLKELAEAEIAEWEARVEEVIRCHRTAEDRVLHNYGLSEKDYRELCGECGEHPDKFPQRALTHEEIADLNAIYEQPIEHIIDEEVQASGASRSLTKKTYIADRRLELLASRFKVHPKSIISARRTSQLLPTGMLRDVGARILSYSVGVCVGRWQKQKAKSTDGVVLPGPDSPIPPIPPGSDCRSTTWHSITPDDAEHSDDIIHRVRQVFEFIWKERADFVEKEACEILGVKELRDYFRKPGKGGFWDDHISRYSKSRRKAPIYWLLQSSKKNYAIWLYYHRLDKDLLFKALMNYVEPKIRLETSSLDSLRTQKAAAGESGKEAKGLAKKVERQEEFLSELRDFEDKLRRAANLHLEPDLNDGVVLNIAPLWELVPWNEAKKYWDELMEGQYEWSSIGKQLRQKGLVK